MDIHQFQFEPPSLSFENDQELFTAIDQFLGTLPASWLTESDIVANVNGQEWPDSSIETQVPRTVPLTEPFNPIPDQHPRYLGYADASPYIVPEDYANQSSSVPSIIYHDSSYIGYSNSSEYSTQWESDIHVYPNSRPILHETHMECGTETFFVPQDYVMQQFQELGISPTLGCNQPTTGNVATTSTVNFSPHELIPDVSSVSASSSSLSTTPAFRTYIFVPPRSGPAPKKRGRKPKMVVDTPPSGPIERKRSRKFPNGGAQLRSQAWLDECFSGGICQLCGDKKRSIKKQSDRLLEHLVSVHFIQVIKNMDEFDEEELAIEACSRPHFIKTQAQFEYTRRYVNSLRCSFCPGDKSLVFRYENNEKHLSKMHPNIGEARREEEMDRLESLIPEKRDWYNIHDKFLYNFPPA